MLAGFGLGALAVGAASVKMAGDFQASITKLTTSAGESKSNLGMVSQGILDMAVQTGTSTKQLADGMYMVESAGFHGAAGLQVLKNSAMGAKSEGADLATVTNAVTTVMNDFGLKADQSSIAVNTLIATVSHGKTTLQDLSGALSQVLPTAAAAHVSLTDTAAAMATMTSEGIPAANAATYLRQTIMGLETPGSKAVKTLKEIGLSSSDVAAEMQKSLPGALQMIVDHLKNKFPEGSAAYVNALKDIAGGSKTMQGLLDLTGTHLQTFKQNVVDISNAVQKGGKSIMGWSDVQGNFNFKLDQAKAAVETLMIKIGTALLPVLSNLLGSVTPLITKFGDWLVKSGALQNGLNLLKTVFSGIGTTISTIINLGAGLVNFFKNNQVAADALYAVLITLAGISLAFAIATIPTLVTSFIAWAGAAWAAAAGTIAATWPIIAVGAAIALLILGIILLVQHWKDVEKFALMIWGHIKQFFEDDVVKPIGNLFDQLGTKVHSILQNIGNFFSGLGSTVHKVISGIGDAFSGLGKLVHGIWDGIVGAIKGAINFVIGLINNVIGAIDNIHVNTPFGSIGFNIPKIPLLAHGGEVAPGKAAIAGETGQPEIVLGGSHGATVLGVSQTASLLHGSQQAPVIHNHIYINGREIANSSMVQVLSEMRSGHPIGQVA